MSDQQRPSLGPVWGDEVETRDPRFRPEDGGNDYDIAIVGLGPVGAVAANLCARQGLRTLVVERDREPYTMPRAIHFDAEIMRIFQSIGVADEIASISRPMTGSVYLGVDGKPIRVLRTRDTRQQLGWPASQLFYQPQLEAVLRAHLADRPEATICLQTHCETIRQDDDRVTLGLLDIDTGEKRSVTASYVLGCDGARSAVRKSMSIALDDMEFEEGWLVVDAMVDGPMRWPEKYEITEDVRTHGFSLMLCDPDRPTTVIPGPGQHRRWEFMLRPEETPDDIDDARVRALVGAWVNIDDVEIVRAAVYQFHGLIAERWQSRRVFLLGDAAHQTPPFYGQGMCHGLRDAANLIWKLQLVLEGKCLAAILESYEVERRPHVQAIIEASVTAGAAICIQDRARAIKRDQEFRAAEKARKASAAMTDVVPPLRHGLIAQAPGPVGDVRGALFFQPPSADAHGAASRLDDRFAYRPALIGCNIDPMVGVNPALRRAWRAMGGGTFIIYSGDLEVGAEDEYAGEIILDTDGALTAWFENIDASIIVLRPDRYIFGATNATGTSDLLADFFDAAHLHVNDGDWAYPVSGEEQHA